MNRFDAIIIGAGQAGPSLAGRLTAAGMTVAVIERKLLGGTCVNTGRTPTKILGAAILGTGGDEAIHGVLDVMNAGLPCDALQRAVPIHPTVSELIPTLLGDMRPADEVPPPR